MQFVRIVELVRTLNGNVGGSVGALTVAEAEFACLIGPMRGQCGSWW